MSALVFGVAFALTRNFTAAAIAQLVFAITPISVYESWTVTPRPIGGAFLFFAIIAAYLLPSNPLLFGASAVILGALVLLTHKMSTQTYFFLSIALSIIFLRADYIAFFIAAAVVALVFSQGFYLTVLGSHFAVLNFWRKNIAVRWKEKGVKRLVRNLAKIGTSPFYLLIIISFIFGATSLFITVSLILLLLAFVTSFDSLAFLGENTKYLLFATPFLAVGIALSPLNYYLLAFLAIVSAVEIWLSFRHLERGSGSVVTKAVQECFQKIKESNYERILCLPTSLSFAAAYFTRKKILWADSCYAYDKMREVYPTIDRPLDEIIRNNFIDAVLIKRENYEKEKFSGKVIFQNDDCILKETALGRQKT